jgi:CubicO group peptidase (beta-lactamase class C family)
VVDKNGRRFYRFGQMSLTDQTTPDENTLFEIASITKTFTTTLVAKLAQDRLINMQAPITNYIAEFAKPMASSKRTITLEDLLNHTSGLPRNPPSLDDNGNQRYKDYTVATLKSYLANYQPEPGPKQYLYSNLAYLMVEHAIESKMKTSYEAMVQEQVLKPLGMNDSHFVVPQNKRPQLATGFRYGQHTDEVNLGMFPAMGGLKSTANDMLSFLEAHIGLRASPIQQAMQATHQLPADKSASYKGAWELHHSQSGQTILFHKGGTNGFVAIAAMDPTSQQAVIVLVNGTRWYSDIAFHLLDPSYPLKSNLPKAPKA